MVRRSSPPGVFVVPAVDRGYGWHLPLSVHLQGSLQSPTPPVHSRRSTVKTASSLRQSIYSPMLLIVNVNVHAFALGPWSKFKNVYLLLFCSQSVCSFSVPVSIPIGLRLELILALLGNYNFMEETGTLQIYAEIWSFSTLRDLYSNPPPLP